MSDRAVFKGPRWVYIAGRGHSGSTVVDAMLGNTPEIESVGELVSGMGRYTAECSCGELFRDCSWWAEARRRFEHIQGATWDEAVRLSVRQAHIVRFLPTLVASSTKEWVRRLAQITDRLGSAIAGDVPIVVDSSKEISRALFLARFVPGSKVIHLVRHPDGILASDFFRLQKGAGFKFLRHRFSAHRFPTAFLFLSCVGWVAGNFLAMLVDTIVPGKMIRLKYEALVENPVGEIERLEHFLDVDLEDVRKRLENNSEFDVGHNIGGNHMRMAGSFRFDPAKSAQRKLPLRYKVMSRVICWPVMLIYGYR